MLAMQWCSKLVCCILHNTTDHPDFFWQCLHPYLICIIHFLNQELKHHRQHVQIRDTTSGCNSVLVNPPVCCVYSTCDQLYISFALFPRTFFIHAYSSKWKYAHSTCVMKVCLRSPVWHWWRSNPPPKLWFSAVCCERRPHRDRLCEMQPDFQDWKPESHTCKRLRTCEPAHPSPPDLGSPQRPHGSVSSREPPHRSSP